MRRITEISNSPSQRLTLIGENNEQIPFELRYRPTQQAWYFSLEFNGTVIKDRKLVASPNILNQQRNKLPFGIMCVVPDGTEPYFLDDFQDDRVLVFLLNEEEKEGVTQNILGVS